MYRGGYYRKLNYTVDTSNVCRSNVLANAQCATGCIQEK